MKVSKQQAYIAVIGSVSVIVLIGTILTPIADPLALILFCALVLAAEWMTLTLVQGQIFISISSAVSFAAALIFEPVHAGLVGAMYGAASAISIARRQKFDRQRALRNLTFNTGMTALATLIGAIVFQSLHGGTLKDTLTLLDGPIVLLAAVTHDQINALALVVMVAMQSGQKPFAIWRENFAWAAPMNVATMAIGGGALAIGFNTLGLTGLLVFFLPVFLSAYAFRAYITRTQAVMAHLEETVQARTADLAKANETLRELNQQKDAFFAVITHDMRSPLTSMLGFSELLERYGNLNEEVKPFLEAIHRNIESLMGMVNNILDLARLDSGRMEYKREAVNLTEIVNQMLQNIEGHARAREIVLEHRIGATPDLVGDAEKLRRMVTNLASNAIKYTREGGHVCVELRQADGYVQLTVSDTGIGIPADQLPHIFERFRRVRRSSGTDSVGTGLGLSIVQEFAQAHGGQIEVHSEEGVGSTFSVTLPLSYTPPTNP
ncbi:MAG TPA: HAMP domain-containing sensor histidine kinase [Anaerolineae bacterium]|nr:HAMP domain-containing sensor histidine kinase [Anaerolineae bacterium]